MDRVFTPEEIKLLALVFWYEKIRPTLGDDLRLDEVRSLRDQYVSDVQVHADAFAPIREWWAAREG